jgi:hypothetical protein
MKKNMGNADKIIRVLIALVLGALYFTGTLGGTVGYVALALGGVFILTSAIGFCPLYTLFGISTCPAKKG